MAARRVIVFGAGIGGLSAALALRRAGFDVIVLERAPNLAKIQIGYGLHLWPNASRALRGLGVLDAVEAAGAPLDVMEHVDPSGKPIFVHPARQESERLGSPTLGIMRGDLHGILVSALGDDVVRFGANVESYEQDDGGVTVTLTGGDTERAEALIAGDGVRSKTRDRILGEHGALHGGLVEWHAPVALPDRVPAGVFREVWGRGARFGFYPIKQGTCWYLLSRGSFDTPPDPDGAKAAVLERVGQFPALSRELAEATPADKVMRLDILIRKPAKRWTDGRVTLLGDAAHAMTPNLGQGAAQSIEDGVVLADCLRDQPDAPAALMEYERRRLARAQDVAKQSGRLAGLVRMQNPLALPVRNFIARRTWKPITQRQFVALHEYELS